MASLQLPTYECSSSEAWNDVVSASASEGLQVVEIYQAWCGRSTVMTPKWRQWLLENRNDTTKVRFCYADAASIGASVPEVSQHTSCQPVWLFLHGGNVVDKVVGINPPRLICSLEAYACAPLPSARGSSGEAGEAEAEAAAEPVSEAGEPEGEEQQQLE